MSDSDKQLRKSKLRVWRTQQRADARALLPLNHIQMQSLFDTLDERLSQAVCDHTLRIVADWATQHDQPFEAIATWCRDNGGYCDCEVLGNCEQHWQEIMRDDG